MGGRQSSVAGGEDRPRRSNSVDTSATLSDSRPPTRGSSRSMMSASDFIQTLRAARLVAIDDSDDDHQPGPSRGHANRPPGLPTGLMQGAANSNSRSRGPRIHAMRRNVPMFGYEDITCPVCNKRVPSDEVDVHLVMCFTRPRLTYNDDVLREDKGECTICFEEMVTGTAIARLPCLCIYHKHCIDEWFKRKNCCPEHPGDD